MWTVPRLLAAGALLLASVELQAHHSFTSEYDSATTIELRGTIAKVEWTNPHSFIHLAVPHTGDADQSWKVEADSPAQLLRVEVQREMLELGALVAVAGFPAKDGSHRLYGQQMTFANGETRLLYFMPAPTPFTFQRFWNMTIPIWINEYSAFVLMALPFAVLGLGLYVLRGQRSKAGA